MMSLRIGKRLTELHVDGVKARCVQHTAERRVRVHALGRRGNVVSFRTLFSDTSVGAAVEAELNCLLAPVAWERMRLTNAA